MSKRMIAAGKVKGTKPCKWCKRQGGCDCKDRVECTLVGRPGHRQCGVCPTHNEPRLACGCVA